nr:MAG TPA: hypothetical protein [Caudoviricetes sp.]
MFYLGTALFTQQKRASPGDGLITQSTRAKRKRYLQAADQCRCPSLLCMEKVRRWQPPQLRVWTKTLCRGKLNEIT